MHGKVFKKQGGSCGYDRQTIQDMEVVLDNQLYKIWNRMSSGSYMAQPVLLVNIPKSKGGIRQLGIPSVSDRVVQMVVKNRFEAIVEGKFHSDSYAYRPNKSAIDAVTVCRERCFKYEWLLEIDIKGYFDNLNHNIMMDLLIKHTNDKIILLYSERFLKAPAIDVAGIFLERNKGTPQGGVVSPLLSNLYLHEAFDSWMHEKFSGIKFERYADDIVVHCTSERQAYFMKNRIEEQLKYYQLQLNEEKTRYTQAPRKSMTRGSISYLENSLSWGMTLSQEYGTKNWYLLLALVLVL